ncbi:predicted methyltransferases [Zymobacter palmae]|uniref:Ribosomal RNA small subunit methyltransferase I n=2 Tax=Zymobacter palmae TaxID=33074 RepID=A0A348HDG4_9GAMM|nr:predicted methyltransferases [Zymobacter palmae]
MSRSRTLHDSPRHSSSRSGPGGETMGILYVVATPIGNLDDISVRARQILCQVDLIAAEDTRHSARLMQHIGAKAPLISVHDHNESARIEMLCERLQNGQDVALISDAGTPLICDPGYHVVNALRSRGLGVVPVPGPCALITALSAAGLPTDRFRFEGFPSAKRAARQGLLKTLRAETATVVMYESPHRIRYLLEDIVDTLGERSLVLARELTKTFETFLSGTAAELLALMDEDADQTRGEFVVMIGGHVAADDAREEEGAFGSTELLEALLEEGVGVKQAAGVAARLLGGRKQQWYQQAQTLKEQR